MLATRQQVIGMFGRFRSSSALRWLTIEGGLAPPGEHIGVTGELRLRLNNGERQRWQLEFSSRSALAIVCSAWSERNKRIAVAGSSTRRQTIGSMSSDGSAMFL